MAKKDRDPSETSAVKKPARKRAARPRVLSKLWAMLAESFPKLTSLLKLARDWARRKPLWIQVPLYAVLILAATIYGFGESLLKLPVVANVRSEIADYTEDLFAVPLPKASGTAFAIAVARIEDDDGSVGKSLGIALKIPGVERLQIDRRLRFVDAANLDAAEAEAHETARRWLEKTRADLLLWGQTIPGEPRGVRLIMTLRHAEPRHEARVAQRQLAFNFLEASREPFEAAVQAQVLGFLGQFDASQAVAEQLRQAIARLDTFVRSRQEGAGRAALRFALANARATLGELAGDTGILEAAAVSYRELLQERTRLVAPLEWAMIQNSLGSVLFSLGKRENGTRKLTEAVAAYRSALEEYSADKMPLEWAMVQNNLGHALEQLGRRAGGRRLKEAVAAYQAALTKYRPETTPLEWAMVQNNLGNALVAQGDRETGTARLAEAIEVFQQALNVRIRKKTPLSWAMTQNNLGNALGILGEREDGTLRLQQAVAAYREALKEYTVEKVPYEWAMVQNNLGSALERMGKRENSAARLEEAVQVLRAALNKRTREKVPLSWAATQNNLGNVLRSAAEREAGTRRLEEAVTAYRAALGEYSRDKTPIDWAMTHNNLGDALALIGEREKNIGRVEEAIRMFEEALSVPELKSASDYRGIVQTNKWKAERTQGTLTTAVGAK